MRKFTTTLSIIQMKIEFSTSLVNKLLIKLKNQVEKKKKNNE